MPEMILLRHPETQGEMEATAHAYARVWKAKGWEPVDESGADLAAEAEEDIAHEQELREIAEAAGEQPVQVQKAEVDEEADSGGNS